LLSGCHFENPAIWAFLSSFMLWQTILMMMKRDETHLDVVVGMKNLMKRNASKWSFLFSAQVGMLQKLLENS